MNAKDLGVVCLVAGVVGAGAAFGSTFVQGASPAPGVPDELAARLDRIENALARVAETQKEAKEATAKLNERVTSLQMDVGAARAEAAEAVKSAASPQDGSSKAAPGESAARPGRAKRPAFHFSTDSGTTATEAGAHVVLGGTEDADRLLGSKEIAEQISKRLAAVSEGLKLRMLPEADRWKKAQDELRLSDGQVESLKTAIADRDKAMKEMMQVETAPDDGGASKITIRRLDPAKAAQAQNDYQKKVGQTLDSEQKKAWDEKGYDSAFGGPSGGSIAVVQSAEIHLDDSDGKSGK
jgi:hypothetical protein